MTTSAEQDPRWQALVNRASRAEGAFYYSVRTTGVYCRPSCTARLARPENVQFHATREEAEKAGFRPCKRCKPDQAAPGEDQNRRIVAACRLIENADTPPSLEQLAAHAGLGIHYFHRVFKATMGLTPKAYAAAHRNNRVRKALNDRETVTEAIYESGFNSNGRFYETANRVLGMTPSSYRGGGPSVEINFATGECSLGSILVARSELGVCAILIGSDPDDLIRDLEARFPRANLARGDAGFESLAARVIAFVESPKLGLDLPLDIRGTAFQQRVWQALQKIPAGSTAAYGDIARLIGSPKAVRAVAKACSANALAVAIPCHRVVGSDGSLSGYRWGVERKRALLEKESQE